MATPQNIVGPAVRRIRCKKGWTQAMLTASCSRVGWEMGENTIAKIEAQIRCVTDLEATLLARALGVGLLNLFPSEASFLRKK